jgi:feruloyl-CoA synthase
LAPVGDKLEIRARGPNITPGYWRQPELAAAAFDAEGFYRMGDAVRLLDPDDPTRGLKFDGRIAEDFKLASGTWVSVGPLRADLLAAFAPLLQDVVIAGLDRDFLAALLLPDLAACAQQLQLANPRTYDALARDADLRLVLQEKLRDHARRNASNSTCIRRALLLPSPPSLDGGEITDKGSINQRAVLQCRAACVAELYGEPPASFVICIDE